MNSTQKKAAPSTASLLKLRAYSIILAALLVAATSSRASTSNVTAAVRTHSEPILVQTFPTGSYLVGGGALVATFTPDGKVVVKDKQSGEVEAQGIYTIDRDEIVISDADDGQGKQPCDGPGKYKWRLDGKALTFTKLADECGGRAKALTSGPCPPIQPDK